MTTTTIEERVERLERTVADQNAELEDLHARADRTRRLLAGVGIALATLTGLVDEEPEDSRPPPRSPVEVEAS